MDIWQRQVEDLSVCSPHPSVAVVIRVSHLVWKPHFVNVLVRFGCKRVN